MAFRVSLRHDIAKLRRTLSLWERKQIPFAVAGALNDTAFLIRNDTVKVLWPRSVKVKQRNFARAAFRVTRANGRPGKATKRELSVAVSEVLKRAFVPLQIEGGTKVPYGGSHIAIPTSNALTPTGRVRAAARTNNPNLFRAKFGAVDGLWLRTGKKLQLMYLLRPRVTVRQAFPFYRFGQRAAAIHFPRFLRRRLRQALRTAR